ncbi:MAG: peptidase U32 family protein [Promethearchaeota archaeon]
MTKPHNRKPELVSPVQDWNTLKTVRDLADAIYLGIKKFNMRARAKNFERSDLKKVVEYCHGRTPPLKVYLATNILIYDSELQDLENLLGNAKDAGIDAIIAHDLSVIRFARRFNLKFHVSTQCNVSNVEAANFYEELGAERIVLARELSLQQIKLIKHHLSRAKIECFIHGSMCTSLIYDGEMFLNSKDLSMIEHIPELINAKIDAFKIEGRMKDPLYVKTVTECYREAIDSYFSNSYTQEKVKVWVERLSRVFNRGFHTGFYFQKPTLNDIELNKRGNISPFKKHYLGKVLSFDEKSKTANVLLESLEFPLRIGEEIIVIGENTYQTEVIKKMIFKGEKIKSIARKRYSDPVKINLRIDHCETNDKIYIIAKT